jgi:hypothetical protein
MDDKSSTINVDCPSVLKVTCPPPGIRAKKVQESSRTNLELPGTYIAKSVALEGAVMDIHIGTSVNINSSALEVACPAPGIGAKI